MIRAGIHRAKPQLGREQTFAFALNSNVAAADGMHREAGLGTAAFVNEPLRNIPMFPGIVLILVDGTAADVVEQLDGGGPRLSRQTV